MALRDAHGALRGILIDLVLEICYEGLTIESSFMVVRSKPMAWSLGLSTKKYLVGWLFALLNCFFAYTMESQSLKDNKQKRLAFFDHVLDYLLITSPKNLGKSWEIIELELKMIDTKSKIQMPFITRAFLMSSNNEGKHTISYFKALPNNHLEMLEDHWFIKKYREDNSYNLQALLSIHHNSETGSVGRNPK